MLRADNVATFICPRGLSRPYRDSFTFTTKERASCHMPGVLKLEVAPVLLENLWKCCIMTGLDVWFGGMWFKLECSRMVLCAWL